MHASRALGVMLVMLCTGCPETWGLHGAMDRAMEKDIQQMGRSQDCPLTDQEERTYRCGRKSEWDPRGCPPECRE